MPREEVDAAIDALEAEQYAAGFSSRDEEVAALQAKIKELENGSQNASVPLTADDFGEPYQGTGAYDKQGVRIKENVEIANDVLTVYCRPVSKTTMVGKKVLSPGDYAAGGIMHKEVRGPGSKFKMDIRMNASIGTRVVALLWPYQTSWPAGGELDFVENGADIPDRQSTAITNHWAGPDGKNAQKVYKFGPQDFTAWTPVEVLWKKGLFVVTISGKEAARYTSNVPNNQMRLTVQTAVAKGGQSSSFEGQARTPGYIQVRNIVITDA